MNLPTQSLSFLDRYLTLWIILAMLIGLLLGSCFPSIEEAMTAAQVGTTNLPIAIGLILMMYPPFAKVRYEDLGYVLQDKRIFGLSFLLSWVLAPCLMFGLAVIFVPNHSEYMTGLILIGLAPCVAMVILWNDIAKGSAEYAAALVAFNAILQVLFFSVYAYLFLNVLPSLLGLEGLVIDVSMASIAQTVFLYLGLPCIAGFMTRYVMLQRMSKTFYHDVFVAKLGKLSLTALLFTITMMFSLKAHALLSLPWDVLRIAIPLILYFIMMFAVAFLITIKLGIDYQRCCTLSFTAASNNFELAIAVAIGVFGIHSGVAFAAVIGPLIEVPVMLALVSVAHRIRARYFVV
jgi:ACR3 family arsenite transporter